MSRYFNSTLARFQRGAKREQAVDVADFNSTLARFQPKTAA